MVRTTEADSREKQEEQSGSGIRKSHCSKISFTFTLVLNTQEAKSTLLLSVCHNPCQSCVSMRYRQNHYKVLFGPYNGSRQQEYFINYVGIENITLISISLFHILQLAWPLTHMAFITPKYHGKPE